ncbi:general odorant-binding protein 1-like [Pararge aegeria]|uniref:Jg9675 protein n=1 Tax=Pararge aegeria aegeria TaxID=348720 RepID=A0A8S4RTD7_9NEOP|nr:general odorant-binding protein 1-like [Pararge aegeria]CAH2240939.1 jg9675 [Pararge aegeria aegeria]
MVPKARWRLFAVVVFIVYQAQRATASQEVMKKLTTGFGKALEECKKELGLGEHIMNDFYNYWREDYELLNRDTGCAIMCMASKFDLISDDMNLHHKNAHEFAKTHGADDNLAKQLVDMLHECEKAHSNVSDNCSKTLEISKCFRRKIHDLKWAPSMEEILEELMTEV